MPRPVLQYCSLPFSWHRIRSTSTLFQVTARRAYVNTPRRNAGLRRCQADVSNSGTHSVRLSAERPAGWSAGPRRVKSQAVASRPAESRTWSPLRYRSTWPGSSAPPQRNGSYERLQRAGSRRRVVHGRVPRASCVGVISCRARASANPLLRISRRRKE